MAILLGNVQAIDLYSGSTPIDRVYLGQSKIYDAFSEISGNLPLTFNARRAENLNDYTIYGTAEGAGVETESGEPDGNKLPLTVKSGEQSQDISIYIGNSKLGEEEYVDFGEQKVYKRTENLFDKDAIGVIFGPGYNLPPSRSEWKRYSGSAYTYRISCEGNATYTLATINLVNYIFRIATVSTDDVPTSFNPAVPVDVIYYGGNISRYTFTTPSDAKYIIFQGAQDGDAETVSATLVLIKGSPAPSTYIPYLQPTDPPVPLPPIPSYAGANRLYSTITLGEVTVQGRIKNNLPEWYKDGWQDLLGPDSWYEPWRVIVAAATKPSSGAIPNCTIVYGSFQDYYGFNSMAIKITDLGDALRFDRANDRKKRKFVTYDSNTRTWGTVTSADNSGYFALGNIVQNIPVKAFIIFTTPNYPGGYATTLPYQEDL